MLFGPDSTTTMSVSLRPCAAAPPVAMIVASSDSNGPTILGVLSMKASVLRLGSETLLRPQSACRTDIARNQGVAPSGEKTGCLSHEHLFARCSPRGRLWSRSPVAVRDRVWRCLDRASRAEASTALFKLLW